MLARLKKAQHEAVVSLGLGSDSPAEAEAEAVGAAVDSNNVGKKMKKWADPWCSSAGALCYAGGSAVGGGGAALGLAQGLVKWCSFSADEVAGCVAPALFRHYSAVRQGSLRDGWFVNACAMLAATDAGRAALEGLLVHDAEHGVVSAAFWKQSESGPPGVVFVHVDERLPCSSCTARPLFARCEDANELWLSLLEKAYAKLHGSYANLHDGCITDALRDLTGGTPFRLEAPLDWQTLQDQLSKGNCVVGARIPPPTQDAQGAQGAQQGSSFSASVPRADGLVHGWMVAVEKVYKYGSANSDSGSGTGDGDGRPQLVKLVDMFGFAQWRGKFSAGDKASWEKHSKLKEAVNPDAAWPSGVMYMSFADFQATFTDVVAVGAVDPSAWSRSSHSGAFDDAAVTAGGSPNDANGFLGNPMLAFSLKEHASVGVLLCQEEGLDPRQTDYFVPSKHRGFLKHSESEESDKEDGDEEEGVGTDVNAGVSADPAAERFVGGLGLLVAKLGAFGSGRRRIHRLTAGRIATHSGRQYTASRQVGCFAVLPRGDYVVVPSAFDGRASDASGVRFVLELLVDKHGVLSVAKHCDDHLSQKKALDDDEESDYEDAAHEELPRFEERDTAAFDWISTRDHHLQALQTAVLQL